MLDVFSASSEMKALRSRFPPAFALSMVLAGAGCVNVENEPAHRSWPKPAAAIAPSQFEGVYKDRSLDYKTGLAADSGFELFRFLTDRGHFHGDRLEMRFSPDGRVLHLRLFDAKMKELDSADLRRGVDFDFSQGRIVQRIGLFGVTGGITPIASGVGHMTSQLHVSKTGGILGQRSAGTVGLLLNAIPIFGTGEKWSYWPKLSR